MKLGDLVIKHRGRIEPEELDTPGLLVALNNNRPGWPTATVMYSFGFRNFLQSDLGIFHESR